MSNANAIAAVTATLQSILTTGIHGDPTFDLSDTAVTTFPVDKARGSLNKNQLNIFLYQALPNAAWRNRDMPRQVQPGETGLSPLPLNLYYLLTAFGKDDDLNHPYSHLILGQAMSLLYDHCILSAADINSATSGWAPQSDLDQQIERVRLTLQPLSVEEISKLWTGFATQYRLSAAYEASVVLIESTQSPRMPLPVLTRGKADSGITALPGLISPYPALDEIVLPKKQPSARLGDQLILNGHQLDGTNLKVQFSHPLWPDPVEIDPDPGANATQVKVTLAAGPLADWFSGFYTLAFLVQGPTDTYQRVTNQLSFSFAPTITITPGNAAPGNVVYTVTVTPDVLPEQRASLLLGNQEILADPHPTRTSTLTFQALNLTTGTYPVRLRVDGVDSLLVDRSAKPPAFDPAQIVSIS